MTDAPATGDSPQDRDRDGKVVDSDGREASARESDRTPEEYDSVPASEHVARGERGTDLVDGTARTDEHAGDDASVSDSSPTDTTLVEEPPALVEPPEPQAETDAATVAPVSPTDPDVSRVDTTDVRSEVDTRSVHGSEAADEPEPSAPPVPASAPAPVAPAAPVAVGSSSSFFVEPPVAPRARHNRGFGVGIALLSSLIFAALYAAVTLGISALFVPAADFMIGLLRFLYSPAFWVPVVAYAVLSVLAALILNRARWAAHVFVSLIVGILVYAVSVSVILLIEGYLAKGPVAQYGLLIGALTQPVLIAAAICAREVALWTGLATAARGRRVVARNRSDREAYEEERARAEAVWDDPAGVA